MFKKFHALVLMSVWALLPALGCSEDKTQLLVLVGSDLEVPTELAEVQVKITADDGSGKQAERSFELRGNNSPLPFSFGIAPVDGNPNTDLVVEFDALDPSGNRLFKRKVVTGFVEGQSRLLQIFLAQSCINVDCGAGQTCDYGRCVSERVPAASLPAAPEEPAAELSTPFELPDSGIVNNPEDLPLPIVEIRTTQGATVARTTDDLECIVTNREIGLDYFFLWKQDAQEVFDTELLPFTDTQKDQTYLCEVTVSKDGVEKISSAEITIQNTPPTMPEVVLTKTDGTPLPTVNLGGRTVGYSSRNKGFGCKLQTESEDADGDAYRYEIYWSVTRQNGTEHFGIVTSMTSSNGLAVLEFDPSQMPNSVQTFARGDIVRCKAQAVETVSGEASGFHYTLDDNERAAWKASDLSNVFNSDPTYTEVDLEPEEASLDSEFECLAKGWSDLDDGDEARFEFIWYVNNQALPKQTGVASSVSSPLLMGLSRGDEIQCKVSFWDDYVGPYSDPPDRVGKTSLVPSNPVIIGNTAPTIGSVVIVDSNSNLLGPTETSTLTCQANGVEDADNDVVTTYEYEWWVNGTLVATGSQLFRESFDKGDEVHCEVRACDDYTFPEWSDWVASPEVTIENTPPSAPTVAITPSSPTPTDELNCEVTIDSNDVDPADTSSITYTYSWSKNGSTPVPGQTLAASYTQLQDTWTCTVTPNDGEDDGTSASADVRVSDCNPGSGALAACPAVSCAAILANGHSTGDGIYWIDPDRSGNNQAYQVYCLMDTTYDGGGWTLVAVSSDDGQDTWTWNDRNLWDTNTNVFGSLNALEQDFKSKALHEVSARDVMFLHEPSGVWAGYNDISLEGDSLATTIGEGSTCFGNEGGEIMTAGTLTQSGTLCDTDLYWSPQARNATNNCPAVGSHTYGPAWNVAVAGTSAIACPFANPGFRSGLGPNAAPTQRQSEGGVAVSNPVGFGWGAGLNSGANGSGENNMKVYVRNRTDLCSSLGFNDSGSIDVQFDQSFAFGASDFTVEAWFQVSSWPPSGYKDIVSLMNPSNTSQGYWRLAYYNDSLQFITNFLQLSATAPLPSGWHHVAVSRSGERFRLFIDGVMSAESTSVRSLNVPTSAEMRIGGSEINAMWKGQIDEVRLSSVARYTSNNFDPEGSLDAQADTIALWKFNEFPTNPGIFFDPLMQIYDSSGNGHHGSSHSSVLWNKTCPANPSGLDWIHSGTAEAELTRSEVTVKQFEQCVTAGACSPLNFKTSGYSGCFYEQESEPDTPMNCVDWEGSLQYCRWAGGTLPEAYQRVNEASVNGTFPWGNQEPSCEYCFYDPGNAPGCGLNEPGKVCHFFRGNSVSGLCDMSGNLSEWTQDPGTAGNRLHCGGDFTATSSVNLSSNYCEEVDPTTRERQIGLRCARTSVQSFGCNSLSFNGSSAWVGITNHASGSMASDYANSIEAWGKFPSNGGGIIAQNPCAMLYAGPTGVRVKRYANCSGVGQYEEYETDLALVAGKWHHIAVSDLGTGSDLRVHVNGLPQHLSLQPSGTQTGTSLHSIGAARFSNSTTPSEYFRGKIGPVRFSQSARYPEGYFPPPPLFGPDTDTTALFNMTEGSGNPEDGSYPQSSATTANVRWSGDCPD